VRRRANAVCCGRAIEWLLRGLIGGCRGIARGGPTALFERFQRREKALVPALMEMYVQGVSTRKVKAITEESCGHGFAASTTSAINKGLDEGLTKFAQRRLNEAYPYLIWDAREKVRDGGIIQSQAVLIAIGINWEGKRPCCGWSSPTARVTRAGAIS